MANHYTDHPELRFELRHPLMQRIVELKERDFRDKATYDTAPLDFEDANGQFMIARSILLVRLPARLWLTMRKAWTKKGHITKEIACVTLPARSETSKRWWLPA